MAMPIMTRRAITGILCSFLRRRNIRKMQPPVSDSVRTLNVENVSVIICSGLVNGVSSDARKNALIFSIARGKNFSNKIKILL